MPKAWEKRLTNSEKSLADTNPAVFWAAESVPVTQPFYIPRLNC
ncbi:MAG: hypothetical protein ABI992_07535 [Chthoniobacterales bacterium]